MGFFNKYPYSDFHELNLDWVIEQVKKLDTDVTTWKFDTEIKFADPIEHTIATVYPKNTIVLDPYTENSFISRKVVPAGVALTNTEYWYKIGNFNAALREFTRKFETVQQLKECNMVAGEMGITAGYYAGGDGGSAVYFIVDEQPVGFYEQLINGNYAILVNNGVVNVKQFGAKADGTSDDKTALQAAIDNGTIIKFAAGEYAVSVSTLHEAALVVGDDKTIIMDGATIRMTPTALGGYNVMVLSGNDIVVKGRGTLAGDKEQHLDVTGEWGHVLSVSGKRIIVDGLNIIDGWGDGIYISGAEKLRMHNLIVDNNRRNGCSVVYGTDIYATGCTFSNTSGTNPQFGVDIEPNTVDQLCKNIVFDGCLFFGNANGSYETALKSPDALIVFRNCKSDTGYRHATSGANDVVVIENCDFEMRSAAPMIEFWSNAETGNLLVKGCRAVKNVNNLIYEDSHCTEVKNVVMKDIHVFNTDLARVMVWAGTYSGKNVHIDVEMHGVDISDVLTIWWRGGNRNTVSLNVKTDQEVKPTTAQLTGYPSLPNYRIPSDCTITAEQTAVRLSELYAGHTYIFRNESARGYYVNIDSRFTVYGGSQVGYTRVDPGSTLYIEVDKYGLAHAFKFAN